MMMIDDDDDDDDDDDNDIDGIDNDFSDCFDNGA